VLKVTFNDFPIESRSEQQATIKGKNVPLRNDHILSLGGLLGSHRPRKRRTAQVRKLFFSLFQSSRLLTH